MERRKENNFFINDEQFILINVLHHILKAGHKIISILECYQSRKLKHKIIKFCSIVHPTMYENNENKLNKWIMLMKCIASHSI